MAMDFGACLAFGFLGCTKCLPDSALYAIPVNMKENSQETSHGKWEEKCFVAFGKLHACGLWADKSKSDNKETKLKKHACWNISLSVKEKVLQKEFY
ncbi:hypothetical protein NC652_030511 [Populus alba x Populus x berolinensis]|nr:hypothetical protein NC652_030511 [Populus alba x Populus x berolinensis]